MAAKICNICHKRRVYTGSKGTEIAPKLSEMCNYCFEEGGWENTHSDAGHNKIDLTNMTEAERQETLGCWICFPELNLAQRPARVGQPGPHGSYTRRPQLNHKGHSHPQTPAARRECKKAFWASLTPVKNVSSTEQLVAAMQAWDCQLDGHGKPFPAPQKGGWAGVGPLGPRGGVGHSLAVAAQKASTLP